MAGGGPTFHADIEPIIRKNCADCHRPGEAGPFLLLTYRQVRSHARQIAAVTQSRYMPPWLPAKSDYAFGDERRLGDAQIKLIRDWVEAGMPEGPGTSPPDGNRSGWKLGQPDLVLKARKPFAVPDSGGDVYWNFLLPLPIARTTWVRALEIKPGDKRLVHHANILVTQQQGDDFGGMDLRVASETFDPDSHLLFWKPGSPALQLPSGMPLKLEPGESLLLNVHLQPSGKPEQIAPSIGLYLTDQPATLHPMVLELEDDSELKIPAGKRDFVASDAFTLPVDVSVMSIYPHAHYLGRQMQVTATFPDGQTKTLLSIPDWDQNWQAVYTYAKPVELPKNTIVKFVYSYDNSPSNPRNPSRPPVDVSGGNRARDEMAHLWLQVLPHGPGDPRLVLQEALSRHEVARDPMVFEAQYNLASMLLRRGDAAEAILHYRAASRLRSDDAVVRNALGSAELANGNPASAIADFREAAELRPDYFDAHYNLGLALAQAGDFTHAEAELRLAAKLKPEDAEAHANLGTALAQLGRFADAKTEWLEALRLNPTDQIARENLAALERQ